MFFPLKYVFSLYDLEGHTQAQSRRYVDEILPIRRKTLFNQSIKPIIETPASMGHEIYSFGRPFLIIYIQHIQFNIPC